MSGYALSLEDFASLVDVTSLHHARQIAGWITFKDHRRRGITVFVDTESRRLPIDEPYRKREADPQLRRRAYNRYMRSAR